MIIAPLAAGLVQMAISRSREYEADAQGRRNLRQPALARLGAGERSNAAPAPSVNVQPPSATRPWRTCTYREPAERARGMDNLFSTHPATASRIEALRRLAADMGR